MSTDPTEKEEMGGEYERQGVAPASSVARRENASLTLHEMLVVIQGICLEELARAREEAAQPGTKLTPRRVLHGIVTRLNQLPQLISPAGGMKVDEIAVALDLTPLLSVARQQGTDDRLDIEHLAERYARDLFTQAYRYRPDEWVLMSGSEIVATAPNEREALDLYYETCAAPDGPGDLRVVPPISANTAPTKFSTPEGKP